jgi:dihydropteroate synthase
MRSWQIRGRKLSLERTLVMGILNVTPDSFSDGGEFLSVDAAVERAEKMIADGADIIDIGGESTRPGSKRVSILEETERVVPVIKAIVKSFDVPISIDTTKPEVAEAAIAAGAEIINDISGLRWQPELAGVAAKSGAGLILMHSRGVFETMHTEPPAEDIMADVSEKFERSIGIALRSGVAKENIVLDIGIGFGKSFDQNLEVLAKLDKLVAEFDEYPMLVGASRKSFIGKILGGAKADERLAGSLAAAVVAVMKGAVIVRVHDVKETVDAIRMFEAIKRKEREQ